MGFFSANCTGCGHPILHAHKTDAINAWMNVGVAIWPDGTIRTGFYDGYGNLDERIDRCAVGDDTTVWHEECWIAAGKPEDYRGPSPYSPDQGWFFAPGTHSIPAPTEIAAFRAVMGSRASRSRIESLIRAGCKCCDGVITAPCDCTMNPKTLRTNCNH